jgi:hypothetical protein
MISLDYLKIRELLIVLVLHQWMKSSKHCNNITEPMVFVIDVQRIGLMVINVQPQSNFMVFKNYGNCYLMSSQRSVLPRNWIQWHQKDNFVYFCQK